MASIVQADVAPHVAAASGQHFYFRMAAACAAVAVIGFAPPYC